MPVAPLLETFVEIGHEFKQNLQVRLRFVQAEDAFFDDLVRLGRQRHVPFRQRVGDGDAAPLEEDVKSVVDRRLVEAADHPLVAGRARLLVAQHRRALVAEQKLELPELARLETRSRFEAVSEAVERHRRQRFEDVHLFDHHLHDGAAALEGGDGPVFVIADEIAPNFLQLVQLELEPQFIRLVGDDKEHFVVLRRVGARHLKP